MRARSSPVTVSSGAFDHFSVSCNNVQTVGTPFTITISAVDHDNNLVTDYAGTITLTESTHTLSPTSVNLVNSIGTISITMIKTSASVVFTTSGNGKTGTSGLINVKPGAIYSFTITGYPTTVAAGTKFASNVIVTAYDYYGNIKTDFPGNVVWSSTDTKASLPSSSNTLTNGQCTFLAKYFTLNTKGQQRIKVTSGSAIGQSNLITVN